MKFTSLAVFLAMIFVGDTGSTAWAQVRATPLIDSRIRSITYVPTQVVRLRGWVGYHIDLEFEPGESFVSLAGGDLDGLTYGAIENHLVLKPRAAGVKTNLTVVTNRRTYIFDYIAYPGVPDTNGDDVIYSLRFIYPTVPGGPSNSQEIAADFAKSDDRTSRNFDYWYCGEPTLQPTAASDDGIHTRLRFGPRAEIPAIFVKSDDGAESLLNYSVDGGDIVIHRTARRLVLRRGKLVGCITNKGYIGAGERLDSGTVSPHVRRETPAVQP